MRRANEQRLRLCAPKERPSLSRRGPKDRIDDRPVFLRSRGHTLMHCRVLRRFEYKELVHTESQDIAYLVFDVGGAQTINPKIEQYHIAQHAVKDVQGKRPIGRIEVSILEKP